MVDNFSQVKILSNKNYNKFENDNFDSILDVIPLGNKEENFLIQFKNPNLELDNYLDNGSKTHNVNISIAAAVTAYARIFMSNFKKNKNLPSLYYTDTDSAYFDGPLPDAKQW